MPLNIQYFITLSSDGPQTTTSANEVITFDRPIGSLTLKAINGFTVKINDNSAGHVLNAGETLIVENIVMRSITIVENGVSYQYEALS